MSRSRHAWLGLVVALALTAVSCAPEPATAQGHEVDRLYTFFFAAAAGVFVVVAGLIAWSLVRYRGRREDDLPEQFHTKLSLEVLWFAIPTLIIAVLFVATAIRLDRVNEEIDDPDVVVNVEGFRWGWRFSYEGTGVLVEGIPQDPAEIVVPVDAPIAFVLTARDVNHAFYVPRWLIKRDLIPGEENRVDVTIEEPGTYRGACAEFCGLLHDRMTFTVRAVPVEEFEQWLAATRAQGSVDGDG